MKLFKKAGFILLGIIILSCFGGYIYFNRKFTPPQNYLSVSGDSENIPITWVPSHSNPFSALLLPVKLEGIDNQVYMQLDLGSPITIFYKPAIDSIQAKYPGRIKAGAESGSIALAFSLQNTIVTSTRFKAIEFGGKAYFKNSSGLTIVGTIGTDLLEKKIIILDFKQRHCSLLDKTNESDFVALEFKKRRILMPAKIGKKSLKLLYDSGTSGYQLITSKDEWQGYRVPNGTIKTERGKSWGKPLTILTAPANHMIELGNSIVALSEVTYVEGTSPIQNMLMRLSGMQGMIGNKLFLNHKVILDCSKQKFKVE